MPADIKSPPLHKESDEFISYCSENRRLPSHGKKVNDPLFGVLLQEFFDIPRGILIHALSKQQMPDLLFDLRGPRQDAIKTEILEVVEQCRGFL